jgi:hypothetical protein
MDSNHEKWTINSVASKPYEMEILSTYAMNKAHTYFNFQDKFDPKN